MEMILLVTGYQADAMFAVQNTHHSLHIDTVELEHGRDDQVLDRLANIVYDYVSRTEAMGLDLLAATAKHTAEIMAVIRNAHDNLETWPHHYKDSHTDETCYTTELWIGPAE